MTLMELLEQRDPDSYILVVNGQRMLGTSVAAFMGKNFENIHNRNVVIKKDGAVEILR